MSEEHDILESLKSLLLKEELQLLDTIKQKVLSQKQFTLEVSKVLSAAIKRAQKEDKNFERALFVPIQKGVSRAFSDNKQSIIDGLLPIMGQLIRKTVANSIKQFVADINRTLELGFSTKALKWRWQAFKTGESFAEIVFQKTIRYQVNEIFLINQQNGLLIEHVGTDDMLKDNNAISAMLSVIQEFIGDSLQSPDDDLKSAEMGDNLLFFSHGPKAFLVFVVKGSPTERLKIKSQILIENVHADFSEALLKEQEYRSNPDLQGYLRSHLVTKSISDKPKKINWTPWIVGLLAIILALSYWSYQRAKAFDDLVMSANSIDGFFVQKIVRENGGFNIKGLVDPLADTVMLQRADVVLNTKPFISLDKEIVNKRVKLVLSDFQGIKATVNKQTLTLEGEIAPEIHSTLISKLSNVIGIGQINNLLTVDNKPAITAFTESFFKASDGVGFNVSHNKVSLTGTLSLSEFQAYTKEISTLYPRQVLDSKNLIISDSNEILINKINSTEINIPLLNENNALQTKLLNDLIVNLQVLIQREVNFRVLVIGQSDCQGVSSNDHSSSRTDKIMKLLLNNAIDASFLLSKIHPCETTDQPLNMALQVVSFKIELPRKH